MHPDEDDDEGRQTFLHKISKADISQPDYGNDGGNGTERKSAQICCL